MAQSITLKINGQSHTVQAEPEVPLLWVIREYLQLSGTKFGCGIAQCGACTVRVDGRPMRSCQLQVSRAVGCEITTIEGIREDRVDRRHDPVGLPTHEHALALGHLGDVGQGELPGGVLLEHPADDRTHVRVEVHRTAPV